MLQDRTSRSLVVPKFNELWEFKVSKIGDPIHLNSISMTSSLSNTLLEVPFLSRHVTQFTISRIAKKDKFWLAPTTRHAERRPNNALQPLNDDPGLFSPTFFRGSIQPRQLYGYVYKLITASLVSDAHINKLANMHVTDSHTANDDSTVTWVHRQTWPHAYQKFPPRVTFEDIEIVARTLLYCCE